MLKNIVHSNSVYIKIIIINIFFQSYLIQKENINLKIDVYDLAN